MKWSALLLTFPLFAQFPDHVPPKGSSQIENGFGITSDPPCEPFLPWDRWWWTRMFDAGAWIRIGQYHPSERVITVMPFRILVLNNPYSFFSMPPLLEASFLISSASHCFLLMRHRYWVRVIRAYHFSNASTDATSCALNQPMRASRQPSQQFSKLLLMQIVRVIQNSQR